MADPYDLPDSVWHLASAMHHQYHGTEPADFFDDGMMEVDTSIADFLESEGDSDVTCDYLQRTAHHALGTHDVADILDEDVSSEENSVSAELDLECDSDVATMVPSGTTPVEGKQLRWIDRHTPMVHDVATILAECDSSADESATTTDETWKCEIIKTNDPFQAVCLQARSSKIFCMRAPHIIKGINHRWGILVQNLEIHGIVYDTNGCSKISFSRKFTALQKFSNEFESNFEHISRAQGPGCAGPSFVRPGPAGATFVRPGTCAAGLVAHPPIRTCGPSICETIGPACVPALPGPLAHAPGYPAAVDEEAGPTSVRPGLAGDAFVRPGPSSVAAVAASGPLQAQNWGCFVGPRPGPHASAHSDIFGGEPITTASSREFSGCKACWFEKTRPSDAHVLRHSCTKGHGISPVSDSTCINMYGKGGTDTYGDDDDHSLRNCRIPESQSIYIAVKVLCRQSYAASMHLTKIHTFFAHMLQVSVQLQIFSYDLAERLTRTNHENTVPISYMSGGGGVVSVREPTSSKPKCNGGPERNFSL
mmetsp:Transcript_15122/g.27729  ORF Transcript_15122/g.27729 Transcript_15122/m.27729 type:complete len:536 (+) Transcript_15122:655-2262(+)